MTRRIRVRFALVAGSLVLSSVALAQPPREVPVVWQRQGTARTPIVDAPPMPQPQVKPVITPAVSQVPSSLPPTPAVVRVSHVEPVTALMRAGRSDRGLPFTPPQYWGGYVDPTFPVGPGGIMLDRPGNYAPLPSPIPVRTQQAAPVTQPLPSPASSLEWKPSTAPQSNR